MKERKFTKEDFLDWAEDLTREERELLRNDDVLELGKRYTSAHARSIARHDMLEEAGKIYGAPRILGDHGTNEISALRQFDELREAGKHRNAFIERTPGEEGAEATYRVVERSDMALRDKAFADYVLRGGGKLDKRGPILSAFDWVNRRFFKPYVTVGVGALPNSAFVARNIASGVWMVATDEKIGTAAGLRHVWEIANGAVAKVVDSIPGMKVPKGFRTQLNRILAGQADPHQIVKGTGLNEVEFFQLLTKEGHLRQSFSHAELGTAINTAKGWPKGFSGWAKELFLGTKFPTMINDAVEGRMRANAFRKALQTLDPQDATKAVNDALINYDYVSTWHRNIRDVIPFAQFTIGMTPRTLKTLAYRPRVIAPLGHVQREAGGEGGIKPPWVAEQPSIPIGLDEEGKRAYIAGLGTPFEDMNKFWAGSIGRTLEKGVAQTTPPIRAAYEAMSGRSPFFGRSVNDYRALTPFARAVSNVPVVGKVVGRKSREVTDKKTGETKIIEQADPAFLRALSYLPWSRQISIVNQLWDQRKTKWQKSISLLTGGRTVSVDEEKELKKLINSYLKEQADAGNIGAFQKFYAYGPNVG
jgi:hypothetical protein